MTVRPLKFIQGATIRIPVYTPWSLTGYTVSALLTKSDDTTAATFTTSLSTNTTSSDRSGYNVADSLITLLLSAATSAALNRFESYAIKITLTAPNSEVTKLRQIPFVLEEG